MRCKMGMESRKKNSMKSLKKELNKWKWCKWELLETLRSWNQFEEDSIKFISSLPLHVTQKALCRLSFDYIFLSHPKVLFYFKCSREINGAVLRNDFVHELHFSCVTKVVLGMKLRSSTIFFYVTNCLK